MVGLGTNLLHVRGGEEWCKKLDGEDMRLRLTETVSFGNPSLSLYERHFKTTDYTFRNRGFVDDTM